jgi:hypothetical protein
MLAPAVTSTASRSGCSDSVRFTFTAAPSVIVASRAAAWSPGAVAVTS